jgi:hypothetical protein
MATAPQVGQTIEMEAILRLAPARPVTRADLEDATMEVERVLEQYALEITDGASASANFETPSIEIDIVLTGGSIGELYQKVALIVTQIDRYCSLQVAPLGTEGFPMIVQGAEINQRAADPGPLVPA